MSKRSRVAIDIIDPDYPYRYLAVRGHVAEITTEGGREHLEKLSWRYLGTAYPTHWWHGGENREIFKIAIDRVVTRNLRSPAVK
ncbi:MAG: hypothetical protein U0528_08005 [Anaerolineae bacterium]